MTDNNTVTVAELDQFSDEILLAIVKENRRTAVESPSAEYYDALQCALLAQLILDYRMNRKIIDGIRPKLDIPSLVAEFKKELFAAFPGMSSAFDSFSGSTFLDPIAVSEPLQCQVDRLAQFIMGNFPGEPSKDEGAIDTAIRLLSSAKPVETSVADATGDSGRPVTVGHGG